MTREEAIEILKYLIPIPYRGDGKSTTHLMQTNALTMAIEALEQEPCNDAISRQAVRHILNHEVKMPIKVWKKLFELVDDLPSVKPQEPKTGYWKPIYQGDEIIGYRCSECEFGRTGSIYRANYCHNCGTRMESEDVVCNYTDKEIAKSFIEDVEAVKDLLPQESEDA